MNLSKRHTPVPNHKITKDIPANSPVTHSYMDPAEMIKQYGAPIRPWKRGWRG